MADQEQRRRGERDHAECADGRADGVDLRLLPAVLLGNECDARREDRGEREEETADAIAEQDADRARQRGCDRAEGKASQKLAASDVAHLPQIDADVLFEIVGETGPEWRAAHRRRIPNDAPATANHAANAAIEPRNAPNCSTARVALTQ